MAFRQHCNACQRDTNHDEILYHPVDHQIVNEPTREGAGDGVHIEWRETFYIVRCRGCDTVSFRVTSLEAGEDQADAFIRLFPPSRRRNPPPWLKDLRGDVARLMRQTYHSLDGGHRALALMGARAVVDVLMVEKLGDVGGFQQKVAKLQADGYISAHNADVLDAALEAGNAAAHRGHEPSAEDMDAVMDIVENLLQGVYHLGGLAARLRGTTPQREKRAATAAPSRATP